MAADQSPFTIEQRLIVAVWVHERQNTNESMADISRKFEERFAVAAPRKATMLGWEKRAFATGSVRDLPRAGRPSTRPNTCQAVEASVMQSPKKSTRKRSLELGIPHTTLWRHMKTDLRLKAYRPHHVNEISDADMDARKDACGKLLRGFRSQAAKRSVLFTDECAIYRSSKTRNVVFWSKENPNFTVELENNPPHVMIWAGLSGDHLFGPYFFMGNVTGESYLDMLENSLVPDLDAAGIRNTVILQQDGAPPHFALDVRRYLNATFPGRWIGRGSPNAPSPYAWPPRSPDLTTPDNALWGFVKQKVAAKRYRTTDELTQAVRDAFALIDHEYLRDTSARTWRRIQMCRDNDGQHTDILEH